MNYVKTGKPGQRVLMMGNEAIARGAVEAGIHFAAAYPGSPSSEIQNVLCEVSGHFGFHAEWSTNEIVALEAAAGASMAGLRAMSVMKQNGVAVSSDFILTFNLVGSRGGLVLLVCDDPGGISSTNEIDTRNFARFADLPLLEPASIQEAYEMTRFAFDLSEELELMVMVRSVTRISHGRGVVVPGEFKQVDRKAHVRDDDRYISIPPQPAHERLHSKLKKAGEILKGSKFNLYEGPAGAEVVIITCGTGWLYSKEALEILRLENEVGILKIGTTWPIPEEFVVNHLKDAKKVLIIEEVDPFLEENIKVIAAERMRNGLGDIKFYGKRTGDVCGRFGPGVGEMDPDVVLDALRRMGLQSAEGIVHRAEGEEKSESPHSALCTPPFALPPREVAFCPGCPHRASFWIVKNALAMDGRKGFLIGDIGCYTLGFGRTGYFLSRTMQCMGCSFGYASGLGQLQRFGLTQPVLTVIGDSTFFHAGMPGLFNARYNRANFTCIILDNGATAMTGFQPHPGTGKDALGNPAPTIKIDEIVRGVGVEPAVKDPFDIEDSIETLLEMLERGGFNVLIFKMLCALLERRERGVGAIHELPLRSGKDEGRGTKDEGRGGERRRTRDEGEKITIRIDPDQCKGDSCGCVQFCNSHFACPALSFDEQKKVTVVDEDICVGCKVCVELCPNNAIEEVIGH